MGYGAGASSISVIGNVYTGAFAGYLNTGAGNVLMGYNSQAEDGLHNATAIGSGSRVAISNALILGNNANVGIGTSAPTSSLHINSSQANQSGVRFEQLTSQSPVARYTDQFLTVNEQGDVVKARYQLRINNTSEWSDKVFAPGYNLQSLAEVKKYIDTNQHLPGIPSAEQVAKEGVDLVKMNATLLEKVEELTLYSIQLEKENRTMKQQQQETTQKQTKRMDQLEHLLKQLLEKK